MATSSARSNPASCAQEASPLIDLGEAFQLQSPSVQRVGRIGRRESGRGHQRDAVRARTVEAAALPAEVVALGTASPHQLAEPWPAIGAEAIEVDRRHPERDRGGLLQVRVQEHLASRGCHDVRITRCVDDRAPSHVHHAGAGRHGEVTDPTGGIDRRTDHDRVEQHLDTGLGEQLCPHDLQRLGVIGVAQARPEGVRPLEHLAPRAEPLDRKVGQAGDDLATCMAGREERVERVEHRGACSAREPQPVDEQGARAGPRCGKSGDAPRRPRTDHHDVRVHDLGLLQLL